MNNDEYLSKLNKFLDDLNIPHKDEEFIDGHIEITLKDSNEYAAMYSLLDEEVKANVLFQDSLQDISESGSVIYYHNISDWQFTLSLVADFNSDGYILRVSGDDTTDVEEN